MVLPKHLRYSSALNDFHRARQQAALQQVLARMTGQSAELLSYEDVVDRLQITGQSDRGLQYIPLEAIVGSVGRYTDFTRSFLPRRSEDAQRWARVHAAAPSVGELPPIEVYKIDDGYFVLDGNHRVSIARRQGLQQMAAYVIEVRTRVPLPAGARPDELIIQAEYAQFLSFTHLDRLRPDADLQVSVPGQYMHLENLIEVHRFFLETAENRTLDDNEAVCQWYDNDYLPLVQVVREQGLLRYFPGRTETDFYVWIARHQAEIRNRLGWPVNPENTVARLAPQFSIAPESNLKRMGRQLLEAITPGQQKVPALQELSWSQAKLMDRYSSTLFGDILLPYAPEGGSRSLWRQATYLVTHEQGHLFGLAVTERRSDPELARQFEEKCQEYGLPGKLAFDSGEPAESIYRQASLADLVLLEASYLAEEQLEELIKHCVRPIWLVSDRASPPERVLLAYDDGEKAREALFAAAYMAEKWPLSLTVAAAADSEQEAEERLAHARAYLTLHEIKADFVAAAGQAAETVLQTAAEHSCDLLLLGGYSRSLLGRRGRGRTLRQIIRHCDCSQLICP